MSAYVEKLEDQARRASVREGELRAEIKRLRGVATVARTFIAEMEPSIGARGVLRVLDRALSDAKSRENR